MRKIYFVLFGVMLLLLILLVDWREKFQQIARRQPAETLGKIFQPEAAPEPPPEVNPPATLEDLVNSELDFEPPALTESAASGLDSRQLEPAPAAPAPVPAAAKPQPFRDLAETPYLDSSRRALRHTRANYDRIGSAPRRPEGQERQP